MKGRLVVALVAGILIWATFAAHQHRSVHDLILPTMTACGLIAARDRRDPFIGWWPSLTMGLAFLSAAYTKLHRTHGAWVTTGAVRYHFVLDARNAPTTWGLHLASSYPLAVLCSAGALLAEATVIGAAIWPTPPMRRLAAVEAFALLAGFWFFQGVFWPLWWVTATMLLLPISRPIHLTRVQIGVAVLAVTWQAIAAFGDLEHEPWITNYPMYSTTYASPEAFDAENAVQFTRMVTVTPPSLVLTDEQRTALVRIGEGTSLRDDPGKVCHLPVHQPIMLVVDEKHFEWDRGQFSAYRRVTLPPVNVAALCP